MAEYVSLVEKLKSAEAQIATVLGDTVQNRRVFRGYSGLRIAGAAELICAAPHRLAATPSRGNGSPVMLLSLAPTA